MFNRKKMKWMADKIRKLEDDNKYLTHMVESLVCAHFIKDSYPVCTMSDGTTLYIPQFFHGTDIPTAPTKECGNVTFGELAKYVIDKEPIAREVTTTKYFEHPDNCQSSSEDTEDNRDL